METFEELTDREIARARAEGRAAMRDPAYVIRLRYDKRRDIIHFYYRCGAVISIPRRKVPYLERRGPLPGPLTLLGGNALECEAIDLQVFIPGLIESVFGPRLLLRYVEFEERI